MCGNTRMNYDQNLNVKGMKMLVMFVRDALHFSTLETRFKKKKKYIKTNRKDDIQKYFIHRIINNLISLN